MKRVAQTSAGGVTSTSGFIFGFPVWLLSHNAHFIIGFSV
jgi:hypothetical protein